MTGLLIGQLQGVYSRGILFVRKDGSVIVCF